MNATNITTVLQELPAPEPVETAPDELGIAHVLEAAAADTPARRRFTPTDPHDVAHAQATPSGLQTQVAEDADSLGTPEAFASVHAVPPIIAVDAGVVPLGHTEDGQVLAVRAAAAAYYPDGRPSRFILARPGQFYLHRRNRPQVLHSVGQALRRPDFYVKLDEDGSPVEEKVRLGPHAHQLADRMRNLLERKLQEYVIEHAEPGTVVFFDGALTTPTFDTAGSFVGGMAEKANSGGVWIVAIAKRRGLSVRGVDITPLLGERGRPTRRKITRAVRAEMGERFIGDLYVAR